MLDLHFHSTFSDWVKSNRKIIEEAKARKLEFIACTDHDYINSDFTKMALESWISSVEWVEISWVDEEINKYLHLTCYSRAFHWRIIDILNNSRGIKQDKVRLQIELLASNWFIANRNEFYSFSRNNGAIWDFNSGHIAFYIFQYPENIELIKKITWEKLTTWSFIKRFLKREWDFWYIWTVTLPEYEPNIELLWELAKENKAVLAIAHPNFKLTIHEFRSRIEHYLNLWVNAIEINTKASREWVKLILEYQNKYWFILTFWSDCHFKKLDDDKHWEFGENNQHIWDGLIEKSFYEFKQKLWV